MSNFFHVDHKVLAVGVLAVTSGVAVYSTWKYLSLRSQKIRDNVYESESYLNQYLLFHYGTLEDLTSPWSEFVDEKFLYFPKAVADMCVKHSKNNTRALDVGCAVGRSSFELARHYEHVIGVDYSHLFIDTCQILKEKGSLLYLSLTEGELSDSCKAVVDPNIDRKRTEFQYGDACCLPLNLGQFDCVLAANLICRLKTPKNFLNRLPHLISPSGILVITSPYSFSKDFTPRENWVGGWMTSQGEKYTGFDGVKDRLSANFNLVEEQHIPMVIRETKRKFQLTFSHVQVWRRK